MRSTSVACTTVLIAVMTTSCMSHAQNSASLEIICGIDSNLNVLINVGNNSGADVYFTCGADIQLDGRWREISMDVTRNAQPKASSMNKLAPGRSGKFIWRRSSYVNLMSVGDGVFRIKVVPIDKEGQRVGSVVFSNEITLKNN